MKIRNALAAVGLLVSAVTVAGTAQAQDYRGYRHGHDRRDYREYRDYRHDHGGHYGWDRGRRYGYGGYHRCWVEYRHHRRYRVCR